MDLADLTPQEAIFPSLRVSSKKALFQEIARRFSDAVGVEPVELASALMERERLGSTGVGGGVAIPHCRLNGLPRIRGAFARLETPIDFEASDGAPVDLVYVLVAPDGAGAEHLKALARVSRLMRDPDVCAKLRGATDAAAIAALLTSQERSQAA